MKAHTSIIIHYTYQLTHHYQYDTLGTLRLYATNDTPNFPKISQIILTTEITHALISNDESQCSTHPQFHLSASECNQFRPISKNHEFHLKIWGFYIKRPILVKLKTLVSYTRTNARNSNMFTLSARRSQSPNRIELHRSRNHLRKWIEGNVRKNVSKGQNVRIPL